MSAERLAVIPDIPMRMESWQNTPPGWARLAGSVWVAKILRRLSELRVAGDHRGAGELRDVGVPRRVTGPGGQEEERDDRGGGGRARGHERPGVQAGHERLPGGLAGGGAQGAGE